MSHIGEPVLASCSVTMVTMGSPCTFLENTVRKVSSPRSEQWAGAERPPPATLQEARAGASRRVSRVCRLCLESINQSLSLQAWCFYVAAGPLYGHPGVDWYKWMKWSIHAWPPLSSWWQGRRSQHWKTAGTLPPAWWPQRTGWSC